MDLVDETRGQVKDFEQQYMDGLITQGENTTKLSMPGRNVTTKSPMR